MGSRPTQPHPRTPSGQFLPTAADQLPTPEEKTLIAPLPPPHTCSVIPVYTHSTHTAIHSLRLTHTLHSDLCRSGQPGPLSAKLLLPQPPVPPLVRLRSHLSPPWERSTDRTPSLQLLPQVCVAPLPWNQPFLGPTLHSPTVTPPRAPTDVLVLSSPKPPAGLSLRSFHPMLYSAMSQICP